MTKLQLAEQFRKAVQKFVANLDDEEALEVAGVFPTYQIGKTYKSNELFVYGVNAVGDPQLYRVVQEHTSQEDWVPDATAYLYSPIGLNESGYPVRSRPTGAHDAYNYGDVVDYNGSLYMSVIDGNTYSPDEYPAGWTTYEEPSAEEILEDEAMQSEEVDEAAEESAE